MAEIVLGMAIPHSGMLGKPSDTWLEDGERDRRNPALWYRNRTWTFPELAAERAHEGFERFLTLEERRERQARCNVALDKLRALYRKHKPDVAIILGKDQKEIFTDMTPSIALFSGDVIENGPPQRPVYAPPEHVTYPGCPEMAQHLFASLKDDGFDLTDLMSWPDNVWTQNRKNVPHAFAFIYHQIMQNEVCPNVPVLINTFYPPTQPSMPRAIQFGHALLRAIRSWDADKKVAIIASGGLTHFVCDTELDQKLMGLLGAYDYEGLAAIDDRSYQSGTSEVKLYAPVMIAMQSKGWDMEIVDYVPCYRTEAGTGEGMGFMAWAPKDAEAAS